MQLEIPASLASDNALLFDPPRRNSIRPKVQIVDPHEEPADATLRLLTTCVEAMSLMQGKIDDLEAAIRDRGATKAPATAVDAAQITALQAKLEGIEARMGNWLQASIENAASLRADFAGLADKVQGVEGTVESRLEANTRAGAASRIAITALQERFETIEANEAGLDGRIAEGAKATAALLSQTAAIQNQVGRLGAETNGRLEAIGDELVVLGHDLGEVRTVLVKSDERVTNTENRMARLEVRVQDFAARHADDVAAARTEAATWRMRTETDVMGFDQLSQRLTALEDGLTTKLEATAQTLAETEAENVRIKAESRVVESVSERLRGRLTTLDSTIADQRARISCLQNKLATATYAIRFEHMSRTMAAAGDHDILDLTTLAAESLVSAA